MRIVRLLPLLTLVTLPVAADYNGGALAYSRKDFPAARGLFLDVAKLADSQAQRALASMHARGEGGTVDLVEAYAWSSLASDQGDATASKIRDAVLANLPASLKTQAEARLAEYRSKYSADAIKRSLHPIVNAAEADVFDLQVPAARLRKQGEMEYPERAKEKNEQGYVCVSFYVNVDGQPLDIRRYNTRGSSMLAGAAERSLASWQFEPESAERRVGRCVEFLIEDDRTWLSNAQVQTLQSRGRKGDARSLTEVARELAAAQHNERNRVSVQIVTEAWLNAALAGSAEAQFETASRLLRGDGCVMDKEKALRWLQLALAHGDAQAQHYVALALDNEKALNISGAQRDEWLRAAAAAGSFDAQLRLAKQQVRSGGDANLAAALVTLNQLDPEQHIHVYDWRAYALALQGNFDDAVDEAENALEVATDIGLETARRQAALEALNNEQLPLAPAH